MNRQQSGSRSLIVRNMLVQEPVQAAIWHCLNHYAFNDAIFLAERLRAEVESDETIWLLATCYYRSGKPAQAYAVLKNSSSPQCKFLMAKCCLELQKLSEAEKVLTGDGTGRSRSLDDVVKEFGDIAAFALMLIATVCFSTERLSRGMEASRKALRLNPFLWSMYEELCRRGDRAGPDKFFSPPALESLHLQYITGANPFISYVNSSESQGQNLDSSIKAINSTPIQMVNMSTLCMSGVRALSPDMTPLAPSRIKRPLRYNGVITGSFSPITPSFGVIPLDFINECDSLNSPINTLTEANDQKGFAKRMLRKESPLQQAKAGNTPISGIVPPPSLHAVQPNVRRSSRIFTNSYNVKENTKSPSRKFATPKSPSRKTKSRLVKQALAKNFENNEKNRSESPVGQVIGSRTPSEHALTLQRHSLEGLLILLREIGTAYLHLSQFECKKAIECLKKLPEHHYNTGWVLCLVGKAYFEINKYDEAQRIFECVRKREPERTGFMETYSTVLWHLQKESALSQLAADLGALDRNCPQTWCAVGNCHSLQKEHDLAIKFFQRAVQVDPNFAYAYTLLGHEYVVTEELEKGMSCFRNAIRLDPRHYNAWYGMGTIYSKQEKFQLAEFHYQRALAINPRSCVLMVHIGVVQLQLMKKDEALETFDKAIALEPNNPLCKFHRASALAAANRHAEALAELDQLKELVPKESLVYYLAGKVHKKLGNTHLALMHFSWATDLDPKGGNNQIKEAIDPSNTMSSSNPDHSVGEGDNTIEEILPRTPGQETPGEAMQETDESF